MFAFSCFCLCVSAWARCWSSNDNIYYGNLTGVVSSCPSPLFTKFYLHDGYYTSCNIVAISQGGSGNKGCSYLAQNPLNECGIGYDCVPVYNCRAFCDTQCEADSLLCINNGGTWDYNGGATCGGMYCNMHQCDTTFNCIEYPFNRCEDVPSSGDVYCDVNGCTGLPYSRWYSEFRQECTNECGDIRTNSITGDTLISFNSSCDDTTQCSEETKCIDFPNTGSYALYKVCITGNESNRECGAESLFPSIYRRWCW